MNKSVFDIILGQQCRLKFNFQALQLLAQKGLWFPVHSAPSWPTKKLNWRTVLVTWHWCIIHRARHKNSTFHSGHFPAAVWSSTINVRLLIQTKIRYKLRWLTLNSETKFEILYRYLYAIICYKVHLQHEVKQFFLSLYKSRHYW